MTILRIVALLSLGCACGLAGEAGPSLPAFPVQIAPLGSPAGLNAMAPALTRDAAGTVYLSWMENRPDGETSLHFATLGAAAARWSEPRTIARGQDWFVNWADTPSLAVQGNGRLTAVWFVSNPTPSAPMAGPDSPHGQDAGYQAWISRSADAGATWSGPVPLTRESDSVEFVSLQPLADGRLLAAWLDGRGRREGAKTQRLYGRLVGTDGPDRLIDASVCDCCPTSLAAFPDGTALLAYRARREPEVRDIHTARFEGNRWDDPRILSADNWRIAGCPVNGPRLDSVGGRVSAAWFTAADGNPRVLTSFSPDAGTRFTMPQRIDNGHPIGRVGTVMLQDSSRYVTWLEAGGEKEGGIYLRRISEEGEAGPAVLLAASGQTRAAGIPRIAVVKDYDATPARLLLAYTKDGQPTAVQTLLVTLPDLSTLRAAVPAAAR